MKKTLNALPIKGLILSSYFVMFRKINLIHPSPKGSQIDFSPFPLGIQGKKANITIGLDKYATKKLNIISGLSHTIHALSASNHKIKQMLYILLASIFLMSCATIMNQSHKNITIYTTEPSEIIFNGDTTKTVDDKVSLKVERKNEVISIVATADSLTKNFEVEPKNSFMYWSNLFFNYGIGMLVDKNSPKRYSYPQRIYINSSDTVNRYYKYGQSNNKGELHLHASLPHINSFRLAPENEGSKINTGFWGITIGLDYYHSKNQFFNLSISGVTDFFVPIPAAVDISGEYELMTSRYMIMSNNHKIQRFSIGYGLSYARNTWDFRYYDRFDPAPSTRDRIKRSHNSFGFIFPTYFQLGEHFNLGIVYRPTFFRPDMPDNFAYEHVISVDFAWKIRLKI